jgi:structural maintenance of chromosome 1
MKTTTERLVILDSTVKAEQATLSKLEDQKRTILNELTEIENAIATLQEELKGLNETLEDKTKIVEQVKRTTSKASKGLDQALKEISSKVSLSRYSPTSGGD